MGKLVALPGRGVGDSWYLRSLPTQAILWFCVWSLRTEHHHSLLPCRVRICRLQLHFIQPVPILLPSSFTFWVCVAVQWYYGLHTDCGQTYILLGSNSVKKRKTVLGTVVWVKVGVVFPVTTLSGISAAHSITSIALLSAQSCTAHPVELSFQWGLLWRTGTYLQEKLLK